MSHFSMFFPTKSTVKLANRNMVHAQEIGIVLCHFPNCSIIYPVGPAYYFPGHPSNTISSGALKFYVDFKKVTSETLEPQTILTIFKSKIPRSTLTETRIFLSQLSEDFQNKISLKLFIRVLVMSLLLD